VTAIKPDATSPPAPPTDPPWRCSFCGKRPSQARVIVCGPAPEVAICDECVELCGEIIAEQTTAGPTPPPAVA
jgi:hypothetical protein